MGRLGALALVLLSCAGLASALARGSAAPVRLTVTPREPYALEPARVDLRSWGIPASKLRVRALSPAGRALRVRTALVHAGLRRGTFRFPLGGAWRLVATDRTGRRVARTPATRVRVLPVRPTQPPPGFGALGQLGCSPPSPADPAQKGLRDVFGTATGEELWALPFVPDGASWARPDAAVFDGLVGKEIKIVFGMMSFHVPFRAIGPDGRTLAPAWGPQFHTGSNWDRQPGTEWGAGFVFPSPGCWQVAVGSAGSLFFLVRS